MTSQPLTPVSEREAEVLAAVGERLTNAQIASRLHLSVRTVETHVSSLLRKLGASDRRELAALAPALTTTTADAAPAGAGTVRGLPATWTLFVGRDRERADVLSALQDARLVTILGPGGAGKTRLAAAVAEQLAATLPLGATFVELVSARSGFLVQAVASLLGVMEQPGGSLLDAVIDRLRRGRGLLVLDNCEHLVTDVADFLAALLSRTTDLQVLTTSRERIGVPGERVVPLGGLSLVADSTGGAAESDAVRLFFDRARALDPGFDADAAIVGELCGQLDGMPLAIELATARTAALGIAGIRAGLSDRLRLLSGGRSADERHRSLRAMLDWSHDLLGEEERVALRRLSRFAGDFDMESASAVTGIPVGAVTDLVGRLADKSLCVHRHSAHDRWALLETVRAYAAEMLAAAGEEQATLERYTAWALDVAAGLEAVLEAGDPWRAEFDAVAADLRAALAGTAEPASARQLARSLGHLTYARRFLTEARQHYLTAAASTTDDTEAAQDLWTAARVAHGEQRGDVFFELLTAAAERAAAGGDVHTQACALAEAVSVGSRFPAIFPADVPLERLQALLAEAERVAPPGDELVQAQLTAARTWTETRVVEVPRPEAFADALAAAQRVDDPITVSAMLDAVSSVEIMTGRFRENHRLNQDRLALVPRLPGHHPMAGAELHDVLHMGVENAVAAGELADAMAVAEQMADVSVVPVTAQMRMSKPIVPLLLLGRFDEAIERGRRTLDAWEAAGAPSARWLAPSMYAVVLALGLRGYQDECADWRRLVLDRFAGEQTRNLHFQVAPMARFVDARLALHEGRLDDALAAIADLPAGAQAWPSVRHLYFDAYPWAIAAEVAVVADAPDADARLAAAAATAEQNRWAAACVARARAIRTGDAALLREALAGWERLGARYERACTLRLMEGREAEARDELESLGVTPVS